MPSRTPQPWRLRESAAYQRSASTTKASHRHTSHAIAQPHGPNRKSHDDIGTSPHRDRNALCRQPRHHHRTAESQQSTHTITISRRLTSHPRHPKRGPKRKMRAENQSGPQRHPPSNIHATTDTPQTAEYQRSTNTTRTSYRDTGHATTRTHGPNRKSHDDIGTSPRRHRNTPGRSNRSRRSSLSIGKRSHLSASADAETPQPNTTAHPAAPPPDTHFDL